MCIADHADDPPAPLAALAPERTVYVSGLSKSVATGLRVGFVSAPLPWVAKIERAIRATTCPPPPGLMTALACRWIEDGTVLRLEAEKRRDAMTRQALAREYSPAWHTSATRRPTSSGCPCPKRYAPTRS